MITRGTFVVSLAALPGISSGAPVRAADKIVDRPLGKYFLFGGMNVRIDAIQTVAAKNTNPALKDMDETNDGPGYIVIRMAVQNPSGEDRGIPGNVFGWELKDGSLRDNASADNEYVGTSLVAPPGSLHPKQTVQYSYVFGHWNGSPITKLFLKVNSGNSDNDTGAQYVRFQVRPDDLTVLPAN
ncbi:MAG: hypothetical protein M3M96_03725 [Candidatus Eremiobacteraeota bacterium]|nr:hypothetical protein [Candidatus Eremiobacteraeota bacterium]